MQPPSKFRDWASMARLPNIPTVWSNVFTGWVLWGGSSAIELDHLNFIWATLVATMFYAGGTFLNDFHDAGYDLEHRPERPIPSGRVSKPLVFLAAMVLLGFATGTSTFLALTAWEFGLSAGWLNVQFILLPLILFYTLIHKQCPIIGGILMGLCRMTLGVYIFPISIMGVNAGLGAQNPIGPGWSLTLFFYICAVSWIAMGETVTWRRKTVIGMLTALPLLDAVFLAFAGCGYLIVVPIVCAGLARYLRRIASPT